MLCRPRPRNSAEAAGPRSAARMFYEAAWACRPLADREVAAARVQLQLEKQKKLQAEADKKAAAGPQAAAGAAAGVPRSRFPLQPTEQKARNAYQTLISSFADTPLAIDARFELAEMLAERDEHDPAIKLLKEALDKEPSDNKVPSDELIDRIRLRLGACLAAKKEHREAVAQLSVVADNPKRRWSRRASTAPASASSNSAKPTRPSPASRSSATSRRSRTSPASATGPCCGSATPRRAEAVGRQPAGADAARPALSATARGSHEARYGIGWARQNQDQYDQAVNAYNAGDRRPRPAELAAKAQLQIGLCRLEQKRYADAATALLVVPFTYDYPELSAAALLEAARALSRRQEARPGRALLQRVLKDYPQSEWAEGGAEALG